MASVSGSDPASQRRSAQRRLAREIKSGTYQPGRPGKAYQQARARQKTGRERRRIEVGDSGVYELQREFSSIADACAWGAANLPRNTKAYLLGFGRLIAQSGDPDDLGQFVWRALTEFTRAGSLMGAIPFAEARAAELFTELRRVVLRWEE
jgi:hypothetical protein